MSGSNRQPLESESSALPIELTPNRTCLVMTEGIEPPLAVYESDNQPQAGCIMQQKLAVDVLPCYHYTTSSYLGPNGWDSNPTSSRVTSDNHLRRSHARQRMQTMFRRSATELHRDCFGSDSGSRTCLVFVMSEAHKPLCHVTIDLGLSGRT